MPKKKSKKTMIIVIAIVVIAAVYYFYVSGQPESNSALQIDQAAANQAVGTRVLALLNQIQTLRIDTSLFKDKAYSTLRDYTVAIPALPVGRTNPFAPIPGYTPPKK